MKLQLRADLPTEFCDETGNLTEEATQWRMMYRDLFEKKGIANFMVVRLND